VSDDLLTPEEVRSILHALSATGARFIIIGGFAMTLIGADHVTTDIHAVYSRSPQDIEKLAEGLRAFRPRLRGAPQDIPFVWDARTLKMGANFTLDTDVGRIDLLANVEGPSFEEMWARSVPMTVYDVQVRVVSLDDLIELKRRAGRPKDQAHLLELHALKKLIDSP